VSEPHNDLLLRKMNEARQDDREKKSRDELIHQNYENRAKVIQQGKAQPHDWPGLLGISSEKVVSKDAKPPPIFSRRIINSSEMN